MSHPPVSTTDATALRQRLRADLVAAMKARDAAAVSALRCAIAAIDNAEAVDRAPGVDDRLAIEQLPLGVGAAEAQRRELTPAQVAEILRTEISERTAAAAGYEAAGQGERAARLSQEAAVLTAYLDSCAQQADEPGPQR